MKYLHTMLRISDIDESLHFYCDLLGLEETSRYENESGRFTLIFLGAAGDDKAIENDKSPLLELTYNWDSEILQGGRNFGHVAYRVDNIYQLCARLQQGGVTINRPPRDGHMAFIRSPDGVSVELLQAGNALPAEEPWVSMPNTGDW